MNDLISRQAAIDALDGELEITGRTNAEAVKGYVRLVKDRLERLPSAQPDLQPTCNNLATDTISRQEAIDAMTNTLWHYPNECYRNLNEYEFAKGLAELGLKSVPPAQPERLTDDDFETIRIHLNAYKEKLCNQRRWKEADEYQHIIDRFMAFASAQPDNQTNLCDSCDYSYPDCPSKNDDVIFGNGIGNDNICACNKYKPSAQPELTDDQAIEHLQESGWMQNHDKQMYEMGLREQLADDSDSYDALLPSAQPEIIRCGECKYMMEDGRCWEFADDAIRPSASDFCSHAERRDNG